MRERESVCDFPVEAAKFLVMQGYNMCRWCYFSSRFTLGLMGRAAVVTLARVAWHILWWPPALSLSILNFYFLLSLQLIVLLSACSPTTTKLLSLPPVSSPFVSFSIPWVSVPAYFLPMSAPIPLPLSILSSPLLAFRFSQRTPMFSLGPDNNCKWSGRWFYFRNSAIIPSI